MILKLNQNKYNSIPPKYCAWKIMEMSAKHC